MTSTSGSVLIEDDDDDVQIVDVTCGGYGNQVNLLLNDSPANSAHRCSDQKIKKNVLVNEFVSPSPEVVSKKITHAKNKIPQEINGFQRPSYNYCRLITQALATMPERRATGKQICDLIAKKHSYYEHLSSVFNWKASIYSALRTRKKFFTIVDIDINNQQIWSFNPTFEQYMLDKWVPKYVQNKSLSSSIQNYIPWLPKTHPQQNSLQPLSESSVIVTSSSMIPKTVNAGPPSPVIVFSGTLMSSSPAITPVVDYDSSFAVADPINGQGLEKDPLEPECSLLEPNTSKQCDSNLEKEFKPWEPEVTVCEDVMPSNLSEGPKISAALKGRQTDGGSADSSSKRSFNNDFSLDNLHQKHVILKEEILYRLNFNKEHKSVEKFRLHCTVCDDHLGTSGTACRRRIRLHSTLGVLVCVTCYGVTSNPFSNACQWCAKDDRVLVSCSSCTYRFCQICIERNFGQSWCTTIANKRDWRCFHCDTKQIWPHRAIAYFLFRHYRDLKRTRENVSKIRSRNPSPRELRFFIEDLSTCCNPVASREMQPAVTVTAPSSDIPVASMASVIVPPKATNPALTSNTATPLITAVSSQQPVYVIGEQPPNYIYVHTPSSVPSLTLNTGTQYIHNVFSDKNYVMESTGEQLKKTVPSTNSSVLKNKPSATASSFSRTMTQQATEVSVSVAPEDRPPPPTFPSSINTPPLCYTFPKNTPPSYSGINVEVTTIHNSPNQIGKNPVTNTSLETSDSIASKTIENDIQPVTSTSEIVRSATEEPILIPDVDPSVLNIQEEKVIAVPFLSARERIERRPMPKSKKQSLLRTVLMSESIESMKRHLQLQSDCNLSVDKNESITLSASPDCSNEGGQNMEEPILKSIIQSATERLLSIQRNQNASNGDNNKETRPIEIDNCIDLCEDEAAFSQPECKVVASSTTIPKIKIKTLRELQDPEVFNDDHIVPENNEQTNKVDINNGSNNTDQQHTDESSNQNVVEEDQVNITDLKQGIIEASRTLINTQKQFKELAKIISGNLIYKPDQAVELITKFHDILKSCHKELDQIEKTVKHQFGHLIPSTDIDSILQLVNNKSKDVAKQRKSRIHEKSKSYYIISNQNIPHDFDANTGNLESDNVETSRTVLQYPHKRKRDLLDFNPLGKKIILGSPEITEEDLKQMPNSWDSSSQEGLNHSNNLKCHNEVYMEELRRRQYLAKKGAWKKKNIWLSTKRRKRKYTKHSLQYKTNAPLMYSEDGSLIIKKRTYKKRKKLTDSDEDDDKTFRPTNPYPVRHRKRRSSELSRPLRLSARMHPSTVAHVAQLISFEEKPVNYLSLIKPCSVVLDRLDPEMVKLLKERS